MIRPTRKITVNNVEYEARIEIQYMDDLEDMVGSVQDLFAKMAPDSPKMKMKEIAGIVYQGLRATSDVPYAEVYSWLTGDIQRFHTIRLFSEVLLTDIWCPESLTEEAIEASGEGGEGEGNAEGGDSD